MDPKINAKNVSQYNSSLEGINTNELSNRNVPAGSSNSKILPIILAIATIVIALGLGLGLGLGLRNHNNKNTTYVQNPNKGATEATEKTEVTKRTEVVKVTEIVKVTEPAEVTDYDVVVIGGGLAGLVAAYQVNNSSNSKAKILLLEKEADFGGNSNRATSGINFEGTELQKEFLSTSCVKSDSNHQCVDSIDYFYEDTQKSGKNMCDKDLALTMAVDSSSAYTFFKELGATFTKISILGGHSIERTHQPPKGVVGEELIKKMKEVVTGISQIEVKYNSSVTELITDEKKAKIKGLKYTQDGQIHEITSHTVIIAAGGYGHDFEGSDSLLKQYVSDKMNYPTTNGPSADGSGIKIAEKIGAELIHMDQVQIHPTGFVNMTGGDTTRYEKKKWLAPELTRGKGGLLFDKDGNRFVNELGTRDKVTQTITEHVKKCDTDQIEQYEVFLVLDYHMGYNYSSVNNTYQNNKLFYRYESIDKFVEDPTPFKIEDPEAFKANMKKAIELNNQHFKDGTIDEFGKTTNQIKEFDMEQPIYVSVITPSIHYTMGGIKIDKDGRVYNKNKRWIKGLYAVGESAGGVHGGNRLGGNSLLDCAVFGRRAGINAVDYLDTKEYINLS